MRILVHDRLGNPVVCQATRILVQDDLGNPIMVAMEEGRGVNICATAGDPDFPMLLKTMGVNKTLVVTSLEAPTL